MIIFYPSHNIIINDLFISYLHKQKKTFLLNKNNILQTNFDFIRLYKVFNFIGL
jgi:hypothetical protein